MTDTWVRADATTLTVVALADTLDNPQVELPGFIEETPYDTAVLEAAGALSKARRLAP